MMSSCERSILISHQLVNSGNASVPLTTSFDVAYSSVNGTILVSLKDTAECVDMLTKTDQRECKRLQLPEQPDSSGAGTGHDSKYGKVCGQQKIQLECAGFFNHGAAI